MSFVVDSQLAVLESQYIYPCFGNGTDLHFGALVTSGEYRKPSSKRLSYQIAIRPTSENFEWVDWEVFLIAKMN